MAWTSRTTRETNKVGFAPVNTPAHVGPGSYKPVSGFKKRGPSHAPFSSTSYRQAVSEQGTTVATPGPGAYDGAGVPPSVVGKARRVAVETPFMSFSDRFRAQPTAENPGPGQYKTPGAFDKVLRNSKRASTSGGVGGADAPAVTWVRVPTAPSIPAPSQSFGYEEGRYGELTMQKPPEGGHTGRAGDTAGPGEYDSAPAADRRSTVRTAPTVSWGRSKSTRTDFAKSFVPGPGAYADALTSSGVGGVADPVSEYSAGRVGTAGAGRAVRRRATRSAAFASRTSRDGPSQRALPVPGPGAYKVPSSFKKKKVPARQQFFGSTARRFDDPGARKRGGANPGPGSYLSHTQPVSSFGRRPVSTAPSKHVGFASTASRFRGSSKLQKDTPDPGAYDLPKSLGEEVAAKVASSSRNGVFGSTEKRFYRPPSGLDVPGPGAYSKDVKQSRRTADAARKPQSMFASTETRFKPAGPPGAPDPGTYDVNKAWSKPSYSRGAGLLASGPQRFGSGGIVSRDALNAPGPGQYDSGASGSARHDKAANRKGVMVTGAMRFQPTVPDAVPGPGYYDTDYVYQGLHKRTFNMSIAEQEAGW